MPNSRMANAREPNLQRRPCGIIRVAALWLLCRYRHKGHWSGHASRCDRQLTGRFGSVSYAMEELIAELGSAFLCAELGITPSPRQDHAQYLANWLSVLRDDKRAIFTAASKASQAAAFLSSLQPAAQESPSPQPVGLGEAASRAVHQAAASRRTRQSPLREPQRACRDC
jgi:antirestriction protein ArdC